MITPEQQAALDTAKSHTKVASHERWQRDRAIHDAHELGLTMRQIAEAIGLSHQRVAQIINERKKAIKFGWLNEKEQ